MLWVPGLNLFRCPARYTVLASFGLALMAGAGLDRTISSRRSGLALVVAILFGLVGIGWAWNWFQRFPLASSLDEARWLVPIGWTLLSWIVAVGVIIFWRAGRVGPWLLLLATAAELTMLYYSTTTQWGRSVPLPEASPILERLAAEDRGGAGLVVGALDNLPVRDGWATGSPYLGFPLTPPNDLLDLAQGRRGDPWSQGWTRQYGPRWLRRLGASHGVWPGPPPSEEFRAVWQGGDPALDRLAYRPAGAPRNRLWTLYRLDDPFPEARIATRATVFPNRGALLESLSIADRRDEALFLAEDRFEMNREGAGWASSAHLTDWDGRSGSVECGGPCIVILRRAFYPGWTYQIEGEPPRPVGRADGGFQAIPISKAGASRFHVRYEPTRWPLYRGCSILAATAAIFALGFGQVVRHRAHARQGSPAL